MQKKSGFSLVELMIVLSVAAAFAVVASGKARQENDHKQALAIGHEMLQYNAAVGRYIMSSAAPEGEHVYTDAHWLRSFECHDGMASYHYLPCQYFMTGSTTRGRVGVTTTLGRFDSGEIFARSVYDPIYDSSGGKSINMMAAAAMVASTSSSVKDNLTRGGMSLYCPELSLQGPSLAEFCGGEEGRVVSLMTSTEAVGQNLPSILDSMVK